MLAFCTRFRTRFRPRSRAHPRAIGGARQRMLRIGRPGRSEPCMRLVRDTRRRGKDRLLDTSRDPLPADDGQAPRPLTIEPTSYAPTVHCSHRASQGLPWRQIAWPLGVRQFRCDGSRRVKADLHPAVLSAARADAAEQVIRATEVVSAPCLGVPRLRARRLGRQPCECSRPARAVDTWKSATDETHPFGS
jgi:hypothetical protein